MQQMGMHAAALHTTQGDAAGLRREALDLLLGIAGACQADREAIDRSERRWNMPGRSQQGDGGGTSSALAALIAQRGNVAEAEDSAKQRVHALEARTTSLAAQLDSLREACEDAAALIEDRVADLSGASKLHAIKSALVTLRRDNKALLVQLGVLQQRHERQLLEAAHQQSDQARQSLLRHAESRRPVNAAADGSSSWMQHEGDEED